MQIEHGPPGVGGVKTLMHVGADEVETMSAAPNAKTVQRVGLAAWALGHVLRQPELRRVGLALAAGALAVRLISD
jgi:hypothetical protein